MRYSATLFQESVQEPLHTRDGGSGDVVTQYFVPEGGWTLTTVQSVPKTILANPLITLMPQSVLGG
ncbi:hypothetical protein L1D61_26795 [Vibrio mediterranei]|nr:hypothetical protein [Vibrio mediterranei]